MYLGANAHGPRGSNVNVFPAPSAGIPQQSLPSLPRTQLPEQR